MWGSRAKDPVLSPLWPRLLLWPGLDPWPRNFHMLRVQPKKKKKTENAAYLQVKSSVYFVI